MDDVWELLHSRLLKHVLLLQHVVMDNILADEVSELLHSTLWEHVLDLLHLVTDDHFIDDVSSFCLVQVPSRTADDKGKKWCP
jgi:hypothetical protein